MELRSSFFVLFATGSSHADPHALEFGEMNFDALMGGRVPKVVEIRKGVLQDGLITS